MPRYPLCYPSKDAFVKAHLNISRGGGGVVPGVHLAIYFLSSLSRGESAVCCIQSPGQLLLTWDNLGTLACSCLVFHRMLSYNPTSIYRKTQAMSPALNLQQNLHPANQLFCCNSTFPPINSLFRRCHNNLANLSTFFQHQQIKGAAFLVTQARTNSAPKTTPWMSTSSDKPSGKTS